MPERICSMPGCDRKHLAKGYCALHYNRQYPLRHPKMPTACVVCGTVVTRRADRKAQATCSVACRNVVQYGSLPDNPNFDWPTDARLRARRAGSRIVDDFDRTFVFEHDGWTCYLCGISVTEPTPYGITSATVDHVVPLSKGGEHSLANVRTACYLCNSRKRDDTAAGKVKKGWGGTPWT